MICKNCGFDAGQNRFCTNCGAEIVAAEPVQNAAPQQPNYGAAPQQNTYAPNPGYNAAPQQNTYAPNPGYNAAPQQNAYAPNPGYGATSQNTYNPNPGYGAPAYGAAPYAPIEDFNLITAFQSFFKKYTDFSTRSRRKEYWLASLANYIITFILSLIFYIPYFSYMAQLSASINTGSYIIPKTPAMMVIGGILLSVYGLAVFVPTLAITVRRLHDIGKSGWFYLLSLIPCGIGPIIMLVFMCKDSQPGMNQFGPNPKGY